MMQRIPSISGFNSGSRAHLDPNHCRDSFIE